MFSLRDVSNINWTLLAGKGVHSFVRQNVQFIFNTPPKLNMVGLHSFYKSGIFSLFFQPQQVNFLFYTSVIQTTDFTTIHDIKNPIFKMHATARNQAHNLSNKRMYFFAS